MSSPSAFQICVLELFSLHVIGDSDLDDVSDNAEVKDDVGGELSDDVECWSSDLLGLNGVHDVS